MLTKIGIASRSLPGISRLLLRRNVVIDLINDEVGGIPILPLSLSLYLSLSLSPLKLKCSRDLDSIKATQCALTHPHFWLPIQKRAWSNGAGAETRATTDSQNKSDPLPFNMHELSFVTEQE